MLLTSASDKIQVITSSANAVAVHASFVDLSGTTVTPGRTNTSIAAAATTDIVASPGASTTRRVKFLSVWNDHATAAQTITVRHTDGTTDADVWSGSVPAQSGVIFDEESGWKVLSAETPGDIQTFDAPGGNWVKPTNFKPSFVLVRLWGGGGGAGGGASLATAVVAKGGSGGGGAVCVTRIIDPSDLPDVAFVSIGYGGLGGLGGSAGGAGSFGKVQGLAGPQNVRFAGNNALYVPADSLVIHHGNGVLKVPHGADGFKTVVFSKRGVFGRRH